MLTELIVGGRSAIGTAIGAICDGGILNKIKNTNSGRTADKTLSGFRSKISTE